MKKLIITLAIFASTFASAQQLYEGEAKVTYQEGPIAVITFGRNGHTPTSFVIEKPIDEPRLLVGRTYQFYLKEIVDDKSAIRANKITVLKHAYSKKQLAIDKKIFIDSMNKGKAGTRFIWL